MAKIMVLPSSVADKIAAGEVAERPSAVVKELVENALDAGADSVVIEIKNGGKTYIRVTDNGCGIDREDVRKAFSQKSHEGHTEAVRAIIAQFGAEKLSKVGKEFYPALMKELEAIR